MTQNVVFCDNCGAVDHNDTFVVCTKCTTSYCNRECQRDAWYHHHRLLCNGCKSQRERYNEKDGIKSCEMPGRGIGVIAQRNYVRGDLILEESPFFAVKLNDNRSFDIGDIRSQLGKLKTYDPDHVINKIFELSDPISDDDDYELTKIINILIANSLPGQVLIGSRHVPRAILFSRMSRFNHSCLPNACHRQPRSDDDNDCRMVCMSDIKTGDEITISYVDLRSSRSARRAELRQHYKFDCECPVCSQSTSERTARDAAGERMRVHAIDTVHDLSIYKSFSLSDLDTAIDMVDLAQHHKMSDLVHHTSNIADDVLNAMRLPLDQVPARALHNRMDVWHDTQLLYGVDSPMETKIRDRIQQMYNIKL